MTNRAATGKAAWSNTAINDADFTLDRSIAVGAMATGTLTMRSYWDIEQDYDYGYVMVNGAIVQDTSGFMTDANPNGGNLGWGLTGASGTARTLRFDLSAFKGTTRRPAPPLQDRPGRHRIPAGGLTTSCSTASC